MTSKEFAEKYAGKRIHVYSDGLPRTLFKKKETATVRVVGYSTSIDEILVELPEPFIGHRGNGYHKVFVTTEFNEGNLWWISKSSFVDVLTSSDDL